MTSGISRRRTLRILGAAAGLSLLPSHGRAGVQIEPVVWHGHALGAATTLILGAAYTLWLVKRTIFGEVANAHVAELEDINTREWIVLGTFAIGVIALGVYPKPLTDLMEPSIAQLVSLLAASKL